MKEITLLCAALFASVVSFAQTETYVSETGGENNPVVYVNHNFQQDPCSLTGVSNNFEDGKNCTQNLGRIVANDVIAYDGGLGQDYLTLEVILLNAFIGEVGSGINAAFVDVYIYEDNNGSPGGLVTSQLGFIPNSQVVVGANFGFDIWELTLDIADVELVDLFFGDGTTYWIGISIEATDGSEVFWENSTTGLIHLGEAYDDGSGGGFVVDDTQEGVYEFIGDCSPVTAGVDDSLAELLNIYPNPATTKINIDVPANIEITDVALYDVLGKNTRATLINGIVDVSNLARGVYILNVKSTQGTLTQKVIKR